MQSCEPNPESSYTKQYQKHEPSSFCYYIKCFDDEVYEPKLVSCTGEDLSPPYSKYFSYPLTLHPIFVDLML